jgi:hypothetical protein
MLADHPLQCEETMMYHNKMVLCVKHQNKILREDNDVVYLPFGSEYTIYLKNLSQQAAKVNVYVDGTNVTSGYSFILEKANHPQSVLELERFVTNLHQGNKFKFIQKTNDVINHRGNKPEDGLIRVEFQYEIEHIQQSYFNKLQFEKFDYPIGPGWSSHNSRIYGNPLPDYSNNVLRSCSTTEVKPKSIANTNIQGITSPGSISNQQFTESTQFRQWSESVNSIILQLTGETKTNLVERAVTVSVKPECVTCGRKNKATAKFCSNCGTSLVLI